MFTQVIVRPCGARPGRAGWRSRRGGERCSPSSANSLTLMRVVIVGFLTLDNGHGG